MGWLTVLMTAAALGAVRQGPVDRLVLEGRRGANSFSVTLVSGPFRANDHRVTRKGGIIRVDGVGALGTGERRGMPHTELDRFEVVVNGKRWPVPKSLWRDCYEPNLTPREPNFHGATRPPKNENEIWNGEGYDCTLSAWLSRDGKRLAVLMVGSDGGGAYWVIWRLRPDGHDTRKVGDGI